jgi:hypothetical protein
MLSIELLDIGLFKGQQGVEYVQETSLYKTTDPYLHYSDKAHYLKDKGELLYTYLTEQVGPVLQNFVLYYNKTTETYTCLIKVISEKREKVHTYIDDTYKNIQVSWKSGDWLQLNMLKDQHQSLDALKQRMKDLYEFMANFDMIEQSTNIKSKLYSDAIEYMQEEIKKDKENLAKRKEAEAQKKN